MTTPAVPVSITFTPEEIALLIEALGSHEYWELSDSNERNNGASLIEDGDSDAVDQVRALVRRLEQA